MSLTLPFADWPRPDQTMWTGLFMGGGPLDDQGPLAHVRATSQDMLQRGYGQWLAWIACDRPASLGIAPATRVSRAALSDWLLSVERLAPMTRLMLIAQVLRVAQCAAPDRDWSAERALQARLKSLAGRGTQARKIGRVLDTRLLLDTGLQLVEDAQANTARTGVFRATTLRTGVMIALLAMMPIRLRAFASLQIGRSVLINTDRITIALSPEMTKTHVAWEADVPEAVLPALRLWLNDARPFLAARSGTTTSQLWIGRHGEPLAQSAIRPAIITHTQRLLGVSVPPHFFRDAAATTLVRHSSAGAKLIRPVLGHTGFRTADRHYIHSQTVEAGRDYATLVRKLSEGDR